MKGFTVFAELLMDSNAQFNIRITVMTSEGNRHVCCNIHDPMQTYYGDWKWEETASLS